MGLAVSTLATPATAATALTCRTEATPVQPVQYSHVDVEIRSAPSATATIVAHYKTTNNTHHAIIDGSGVGDTDYNISGATPGYRVVVNVTVHKGSQVGHCATYFIPRRRTA
jgi:hypothetical protein